MKSFYSDDQTWLHHVPAGAKLFCLALLGALVYGATSMPILIGCAAINLMVFASLGHVTQRARSLLMGLTMACFLIGLFHAYQQHLLLGIVSVLRLLCTTLMGIALTLTTRYTDLLAVFEWLLHPLKIFGIQPERLSLQLALMLRFTEHFFMLWQRLDDAHRLRTGKAGGFRILAPFTLHLLVTARRVADTLHVRLRR